MFERWIQDLLNTYKLSSVMVGMEPTGHYWFSLARWLVAQGNEAVLVNPHFVKKNKENRDNTPSKSDRKDALVIADMIKNGYYSPVRFHYATNADPVRYMFWSSNKNLPFHPNFESL